MLKGSGTDIVEINRISSLNHKERFVKKLLSNDEYQLFLNFKSEKRQHEFLAGRWAVKEALYKALGTYCDGKSYTEFSILNDENGKPYLDKPQLEDIHLSLSHCEQYAVAFVVVESN